MTYFEIIGFSVMTISFIVGIVYSITHSQEVDDSPSLKSKYSFINDISDHELMELDKWMLDREYDITSKSKKDWSTLLVYYPLGFTILGFIGFILISAILTPLF